MTAPCTSLTILALLLNLKYRARELLDIATDESHLGRFEFLKPLI